MVEIEIDGEGIALGRINVNGGGAGGKVFGGKIELKSGASKSATAVIGTEVVGLARRREWFEVLVLAGNLNIEILPEIVGTRDEAFGRTGAGTCGANDKRAIGIGELDLNDDSYEFALVAMIEGGLLGAVAGGVLAGLLHEKGERSEGGDGINVRAGFGRRKKTELRV